MKNSVTQAAREGARKAAITTPWNNTTETAVKQYVIDNSELSLQPNDITFTQDDIIVTTPVAGKAIKVSVRMSFSSVVPNLIPVFKNLTSIRAAAAMRYE